MNYIDLHCDTLSEAFLKGKRDIFCFPEAMADVQLSPKGRSSGTVFCNLYVAAARGV